MPDENIPQLIDPAGSPNQPSDEINLLYYLEVVLKRKKMIAKIAATAFVLSIAYSLLLPNIYSATAKIIPPQQNSGLMGMMIGGGGAASLASNILGTGTTADQYAGMLDSVQIKKSIVKRFNLMEVYDKDKFLDIFKELDKMVDITVGKKDGIISISVEDEDPERAANIANTFVEELEKLDAKLDMSGGGQDKLFYENRLAKAKVDLAKAEDTLKNFQSKNKALDVPAQAQATIAGVAQLMAQLAVQEAQLATLRSRFTDTAQEVMDQKATIANIRGQIARLEGNDKGGSIPSVGSVPALGQEFMRLMREFKIQETLVELLTKQSEIAKLTESKNYSTIQIVQSAEVPDKKIKPKRSLIVLVATFVAFFFAVFFTFVLEYVERMPESDRVQWREVMEYIPESGRSLFARFISKR
jgi:tyrosine-protein kinase Etk/Wzc